MKKDHYTATLKKIQKSLEYADKNAGLPEIRQSMDKLKDYIPERLQFLEKVIKSLGQDGEDVSKNTLSLLKQAPGEILKNGERTLKNAAPVATPELHSLVKEFNTISKEYAANYIDMLERNGIK